MQEQASASASATNETQESIGPTPITKLEMAGILASDIKKMQDIGLHTIESVAYSHRKVIMGIKGISEAKAEKILVIFLT
jgi:DNA repair protein RAD51